MKHSGEITIEGVVVEVREGSKKIRRNYTYSYRRTHYTLSLIRIQI